MSFFLASLVLSCSQLVYRAVGMSENPEGQELIKGLLLLHTLQQPGRTGGHAGISCYESRLCLQLLLFFPVTEEIL